LHDREQFEIHAFSFGPDTNDEMNLRIKAGVDHFHNVREMSHKDLAMLSRSLEIDIAVDLGGYTANSRTQIFAMSVAPIQINYIGYLGSLGSSYYDYLIADQIMIPEMNKKYFAEKIIYLPNFQVNDSKESPPEVVITRKDLGLPEKGFVFCCFNNTYKITPSVFDSWARILQSVKDSVFLIYAGKKSAAKDNLLKEIVLRGVDPQRMIFGESLPRPAYLARYRAADLFLDTHPYNAGATASDALRMGLPVLTWKGNSYPSRMAASILNSVNLPELIADTQEEYESLAIELATNNKKYIELKSKLDKNLNTEKLLNTLEFSRHIESAYKAMYEKYHDKLDKDHIYINN
jgi:predicted O-linked N-acetylglucosamine transferase (SPINDLY family)